MMLGFTKMHFANFFLFIFTILLLLFTITTVEASSIFHLRLQQQVQQPSQQQQIQQPFPLHESPSLLLLPGRAHASTGSVGCSSLALDAPLLSFVDEEPPRVLHRHGFVEHHAAELDAWPKCSLVFECKVMSSPPEVNVIWYRNSEVIKATALRDATLGSATSDTQQRSVANERAMIGLSQMTHRLCLDSYTNSNRRDAFQCRVESACQPMLAVQSPEIVVGKPQSLRPLFRPAIENNKSDSKRNIHLNEATVATPISASAPLITMITSTRMELAGRDVQLACHAAGVPWPHISWSVIDENNEQLSYPADEFSFINRMPNGDIIVSTSNTNLASVTLQCIARNSVGVDRDIATIILLDE